MEIGVPKETKKNEFRVALTPLGVEMLTDAGHRVQVQTGAGTGAGFTDADYQRAGAETVYDVYHNPMIVRVKQPPFDTIRENQIIVSYPHIDKHQDPPLEQAFLEKKVAAYAYEEFRHKDVRTVNLGFEAGLVGAYEALRLYGQKHGIPELAALKDMRELGQKVLAYSDLRALKTKRDIKIFITGKGLSSRGAQETLNEAGLDFEILYRPETARIADYLPLADIFLNCIVWRPGDPRLITEDNIHLMKKDSVISDVSCDKGGSVAMCEPHGWDKQYYPHKQVLIQAIDNLPSSLGRDASEHLEQMSLPYLLMIAAGRRPRTGLMTENGQYVFTPPK